MIQKNATSLCIIEPNGDMTMTSRLPKIISTLKEYNILYVKRTQDDINDIIGGVPGNGYLDYDIFVTELPFESTLHYHDDNEARAILSGSGEFTIFIGEKRLLLHMVDGDYVTIPAGLKHTFKTDGPLSAVLFFTQRDGGIAIEVLPDPTI